MGEWRRRRWEVFAGVAIAAAFRLRARGAQVTAHNLAVEGGPAMGWFTRRGRLSDEKAIKKFEMMLGNADIAAGLRQAIPEMGGPSFGDVAVRFKELLDSENETIAAQMVRLGFSTMVPKPAKKVEVDQRTLVARIDARSEAPPIRARAIVPQETLDA